MPVQYLLYQSINKQRWDECIETAGNGLIYGYSFYLDAMSEQWDALVLNDYEAVMPLTWKRKYGIRYLYQPFFTASLGVFGNNISAGLMDEFLMAVPSKFKYWDIYFNPGNYFQLQHFNLYQRMNYVLLLDKSYEMLYDNFRNNIKRNIKKSAQLNCVIKKNIDIDLVIQLAVEQATTFSPITTEAFARFKKLFNFLSSRQQAVTYAIASSSGEILASCAFVFSHNRAYYILVGNHPNGKTLGASHALINAFIKDYAGQQLLLDFEGSDVNSLAFFYSSFGAVEEKYTGLKNNRLPFLLKYFK